MTDTYKVGLSFDDSQAKKTLQDLTKSIKSLTQVTDKLVSAMSATGKNIKKTFKQASESTSKTEENIKKFYNTIAKLNNIKVKALSPEQLKAFNSEVSKANKQLFNLRQAFNPSEYKQFDKIINSLRGKYDNVIESMKSDIDQLTNSEKRAFEPIIKLRDGLAKLQKVNAEALSSTQLKALKAELSRLNRELFKLKDTLSGSEYKKFDKVINDIDNEIKRLTVDTSKLSKTENTAAKEAKKLRDKILGLKQEIISLSKVKVEALSPAQLKAFNAEVNKANSQLFKTRKALSTSEYQKFDRTISGIKTKIAALNKPAEKFKGILHEWWKRFGQVALGFTIVYRAMNLIEDAVRDTFQLFKEGIQLSGELAAQQGKLATYATIAAKGQLDFNQAMRKAKGNISAIQKASLNVVSSLDEIITAYDEVAIHGGNVPKKLIPAFASLTDFTLLIAKTSGDSMRQLRSELNALFTGQMKKTNILINFMVQFNLLTKEQVANLRKANDNGKSFVDILTQIQEPLQNLSKILLQADVGKAYEKWRDALKQIIAQATNYASANKKQLNIFAAILQKHKEYALSLLQNERIMKRFVLTINVLASAFDKFLSFTESLVIGIADLVTMFKTLSPVLSPVVKSILMFEAAMASWSVIKLFGGAIAWLNKPLIKLAETLKKINFSEMIANMSSLLNVKNLAMLAATVVATGSFEAFRYATKHKRNIVTGDINLNATPEKPSRASRPSIFKAAILQVKEDLNSLFSLVFSAADKIKLPANNAAKEFLNLFGTVKDKAEDLKNLDLTTHWFDTLKKEVKAGTLTGLTARLAKIELAARLSDINKQIQALTASKGKASDANYLKTYLKIEELKRQKEELWSAYNKIMSGAYMTESAKNRRAGQMDMFNKLFSNESGNVKSRKQALEFVRKMISDMQALHFSAKEAAPYIEKIQQLLKKFPSGKEKFASQMVDLAKSSSDAWGQVTDTVTGAINTMEDTFVSFVQTGKLEFKSLVDSILADIARMTIKQAVSSPLESFLGSLFSQGASVISSSFMPTVSSSTASIGSPYENLSLFGSEGGPMSNLNVGVTLKNVSGQPMTLTNKQVSFNKSAQQIIVEATVDAKQRNVGGFRFT